MSSKSKSRQGKGADGDGVFGKAGEGDFGVASVGVHDTGAEGGIDGGAEGFAEEGKAATEDDDFGVKKLRDVGKGEGKVVSGVRKNFAGDGVVGGEGRGEEAGFSAGRRRGMAGEEAFWVGGNGGADFGIDRPAGAA